MRSLDAALVTLVAIVSLLGVLHVMWSVVQPLVAALLAPLGAV